MLWIGPMTDQERTNPSSSARMSAPAATPMKSARELAKELAFLAIRAWVSCRVPLASSAASVARSLANRSARARMGSIASIVASSSIAIVGPSYRGMISSSISSERSPALSWILSRTTSSSGGGVNPRRSGAAFDASRTVASTADRSTASEYVPRIASGAAPGHTTLKSSPTFCAKPSRRYSAAALSRAYSTVRCWSALMLTTRSFDRPRTTCPSRPTATRSRDVPTNAMSSFVRTVTGTRAIARTSGSTTRLRRRDSSVTPLRRLAAPVPTGSQGSRTVVAPTKFVISHSLSIRATSKSPAVADTTLPVSTST